MYTYCLYCETGKCEFVAEYLRVKLQCRAIIPKQVQHTLTRGIVTDYIHDLLPGYLFVYSDEPANIYLFQTAQGVARCLRNGDGDYELHGSDEAFAMLLWHKNGIIGKTQVTEKNGVFTVAPKAFRGADVSIKKVDRRNGRMQIEIHFLNQIIRTWIEFEIVPDTDSEQTQGEALLHSSGSDLESERNEESGYGSTVGTEQGPGSGRQPDDENGRSLRN